MARSKQRAEKTRSSRKAKAAASSPPDRLSPDTPLLRVAILFFVIYALLQTATWYLGYRGLLQPVMRATASLTGACASLTGVNAVVSGNEVRLASRILRIDVDCTGIALMTVFSALVLAYPLAAKRKLLGLAIGLPVLVVANLIRLTAVAQLSGPLSDRAFLFVHDYLFQIGMMLVVILLWATYLAWARRHAT